MNKSISRETLSVYPKYSKLFVIHTDASKVQLGAIICQDNKPIAFYSRKLNPAQLLVHCRTPQESQKHSLRSANKGIY